MNGRERIGPYVAQIQHEHRELNRQVDEIAQALMRQEGCEAFAECRDLYQRRLTELREHLVKHFTEEEHDGYMEEALSSAPHLAAEAMDLERENPVILQAIDRILNRLNRQEVTAENWGESKSEFKKFARFLLTHEAHENRLLQHGFNVDLDLPE